MIRPCYTSTKNFRSKELRINERLVMTEVTTLDLDQTVTREQYEHAITHLAAFLETTLRRENDWCEERFRYFRAIMPEFSQDSVNFVNLGLVAQDADYAQLLKDIRARVLFYTHSGTINLDTANRIFEAAGLPAYGIDTKTGVRMHVYMPPLALNVAVDGVEEARAWLADNLLRLITDVMDGSPVKTDDNKYVPGSLAFDNNSTSIGVMTNTTTVRESDILRPHEAPTRRPHW